ncbi:sensor domain CHASE3-containing protein [Tistlia consotensis]|uniref:histidine kinase n=1 Tax=Tistlia consotensis USBA 355 TaxID=560819 RepID=A0A1Y6CVF2_9PROT|nr:CHASE3 domain-containing protein [Tistlia consotensis]SMF80858.1 sensor domain CHASE3-containing protein [Tistlia consotensis USBA 355]SNS21919.1 sensor domain CHASE3-containing protein [Tistlia consotensis]
MPISKSTYIGAAALLLLLGLAALLAIVATSLVLVARSQQQFAGVVTAREVRSAAADLLALVQDMETGQRGYLLTGDESYLAPYRQAVGQVARKAEALRRALRDFPDLEPVLGRLSSTLDAKLAELADTLQLYRSGAREQALAMVDTDRGNKLMEQLRGELQRVRESAEVRLDLAVDRQRASADLLRWVSILGAVAVILVVAGAVWLVLRYTRVLGRARQDVERLNAELEERVRDRTAELGRANEEIQRFAYIVTHDLRAPLVNIMGFTSELETSLATLQSYVARVVDADQCEEEDPATVEARIAIEEDLPESIGFIRSSTRKMDGLINAILKISRDGRRPLKPVRLDLRSVIETSVEAIQHQLKEHDGAVELDIRTGPIVSDRLSLEQIFGNLLDNAVKYRQPDRPLRLAVSSHEAPGRQIVVEIRDNGRGISPQDHERVFELFRRSGSQDQPGEGIGLAHVRALVRSLGGDITLASEFGAGTTFRIRLQRDLGQFLGSSRA